MRTLGWGRLRRALFLRDRGICQVCLLRVGRLWDVGHLVDRCMGGEDLLENLVLMCVHCNRTRKPLHRTRDEALAWLSAQQDSARGRKVHADWERWCEAMFG